jgi:hypothetical protein
MKPHLLGQNRHPSIIETGYDGIHPSGMAGIEDEELAEGLDLLGGLHDIIGADHALIAHLSDEVMSEHILLSI